jgi:hypothetical protein
MSWPVISCVIFALETVSCQACGSLIASASEVGTDVCRRRCCSGRWPGAWRAARDQELSQRSPLVWVLVRRRAGLTCGHSLRAAAGSVSVRKLGTPDIAGPGGQLQGSLLAQRLATHMLTTSREWTREVCSLVDYWQLAKQRGGLTTCVQVRAAIPLRLRITVWGWVLWWRR